MSLLSSIIKLDSLPFFSQLWRPTDFTACILLTEGFYLIQFGPTDDMNKVLWYSLWFINVRRFLSVRLWESKSNPNKANLMQTDRIRYHGFRDTCSERIPYRCDAGGARSRAQSEQSKTLLELLLATNTSPS